MSSLAGPSSLSHTLPAIPARPSQPTPIATKLRRTQDGPDSPAFASPAPGPPSAAPPGTPLLGGSSYAPTAYGTAPATPVARSSSVATTEVRETSLGPPTNGHAGSAPNGAAQRRTSIDPKLALVPDLAAVYARANAQSRKRGRGSDEEEAMAQTAVRYVKTFFGLLWGERDRLLGGMKTMHIDRALFDTQNCDEVGGGSAHCTVPRHGDPL